MGLTARSPHTKTRPKRSASVGSSDTDKVRVVNRPRRAYSAGDSRSAKERRSQHKSPKRNKSSSRTTATAKTPKLVTTKDSDEDNTMSRSYTLGCAPIRPRAACRGELKRKVY